MKTIIMTIRLVWALFQEERELIRKEKYEAGE